MIYPKNFEQKIGFDSVRQMIKEFCLSQMGEKYVDKIRFISNFELLIRLLTEVEEFVELLSMEGNFPSFDYFDLTSELTRINIEGTYIEQEKLFDLKSSLTTILECVSYIRKQEEGKFLSLRLLTEQVEIDQEIIQHIKQIIDEKGNIKDSASAKLKDVRKQLVSKLSSIDKRINSTLKQAKKAGLVKDDVEVSIRQGRLVIPVPAAYKRQLKGFIHDQSATGQTVYIEPEEIFDTNNEIRELEGAERREIIQILRNFSSFVRPLIPSLMEAYKFLGLVDFIRAKAKFAIKTNGIKPKINNEQGFSLEKAVHPLLYISHQKQNKPVVPLDIELNEEQRILIISGPNAGGKSVCLKTIGLLQYMLQCGFLIPVKEGSISGIFQKLFIDIGDEQSLENDLSTYSSHLLNIKYFVLNSSPDTLFLIDEFGTGTEPQLGGAIAEAILEKLNEKQAFGVITTHYSNLKLMASEGNGVVNGAMLFDTKAMQPLYLLSIGKPGSSFAFEIARKIGFPKVILKSAEKKIGKKQLDFDQQLQQLEVEKKELEKKQEKFHVADDFLSEMIDKYESLSSEIESKKTEILENAKKEALQLVDSSNKLIENTIREIRESQAEKEKTKNLRKKLSEKKEEIKTKVKRKELSVNRNEEIEKVKTKHNASSKIRLGDFVRIIEQDVKGEVLKITGEDVIVGFGSVTLKTQLKKVEKLDKKESQNINKPIRKTKYSGILNELNDKMANFKLQLDVRGKRGEEAVEMVRQYIDDAILLNIREIKILHGKGYGILRSMIHEYLQTISEIKQFKDEHIERGGHGITIVILK